MTPTAASTASQTDRPDQRPAARGRRTTPGPSLGDDRLTAEPPRRPTTTVCRLHDAVSAADVA